MSKYLYCCQNTVKNFYDHIIPVPNDFDVNPVFLSGIDKEDFMNGLSDLTIIIRSVYADIIQQPAEYGLPMVEDIEYSSFNPKAADSKNSAHRLITLLHTLVQSGELSDSELIVDNKVFSEKSKKLKSIYKITNYKMILHKLCEFGFIYENNILSFPDNNSIVPILYAYMKNVKLEHTPVFSLNYFLAAVEMPSLPVILAKYISGDERVFAELLCDFLEKEGFIVGSTYPHLDYLFSIEYLIDAKNEKRIARIYSGYGKLLIRLKLHSSDCYDYYLENLPERIKQIFRKESSCCFCKEPCTTRLTRTFEGITYTDCGYGNYFDVVSYDPNDIKYYKQIVSLEVKAEKTSARRKGTKV
ncbi:MAG: hypothetical protein K0S47_2183 [Herbinix sp.]|jgi:hypothetical protein|nr:hypothetical protein [Herbinix sp.]